MTEEIEAVDEEIIVEKVPLDIPLIDNIEPILEELSAEEKANIALQKAIAKKKAEEKKRDDENQTKLF
jgi:topoisomerase-4 subunit A